jgi:hypothetical protein
MFEKISYFYNKYFFKKRLILNHTEDGTKEANLVNQLNGEYTIFDFDILDLKKSEYFMYIKFLLKYIRKEKVRERIRNPLCKLIFAIKKESLKPVGFYWGIISSDKVIWHDCFPLKPNNVLLFNAMVEKENRNKGVYSLLIRYMNDFFIKKNHKNIFTVVEKRNIHSLKANLKSGCNIYANNYLIKFFGRNVFSIFIRNNRLKIYYVFKNYRGNNL